MGEQRTENWLKRGPLQQIVEATGDTGNVSPVALCLLEIILFSVHINRLKCACISKNTSLSQLLGRFFRCIFGFTVNMCQNRLITDMLTDYREGLNPTTPQELFLIVDRVGRHFDWDEQVRMRI